MASSITRVGSEILVNTATVSDQYGPQITALSNGGFVVTWYDESLGVGGATGDASGYAVKAQVFAAGGAPVGSEILVNTATFNLQYDPQITALSNGGFVVTWNDYSEGVGGATGDASSAAVKAQVFTVTDVNEAHSDFNGDGNSDVLWRHETGQVYFWEMDGSQTHGEGSVAHAPVPNDWHVEDVGDFDGDGSSDILWRHDSGQVYLWEMDGLQIKGEGSPPHAPVPNDWHIQGIGEFDADGKSDILWRHDNGQVHIWEMDGLNIKAEGTVMHAAVPNDWHIQDVGDFNGDGNSDILWRHDSGQVYLWEMDGLQVKDEGAVAHAAVPSDWHVL